MMLDVVPHNDGTQNCLESCLSTIMHYLGHDYELMYSEGWFFNYKPKDITSEATFNERLGSIEFGIDFIEKFCGVKFSFNNTNKDNVVHDVIAELGIGHPVVVLLDCFWVPGDPSYQVKHNNHFFVIVGHDDSLSEFFCINPFGSEKSAPKIPLPEKCLAAGCDMHSKIDIKEIQQTNIVWNNVISSWTESLVSKSVFDLIRTFANDLSLYFDLNSEMNGCSIIWQKPFFLKMEDIYKGRVKFAIFLKFIANKYNVGALNPVCDQFNILSSKWNTIYSMLIKAAMSQDVKKIIPRVADRIKEIADSEESIAQDLLKICNLAPESKLSGQGSTDTIQIGELAYTDIVTVDLEKHFNNNSFSSEISSESVSDLTGTGQYLLNEGLPEDRVWKVGNMIFSFPKLDNNICDNIICVGQEIEVPIGQYDYIMLLGCADFGSFVDMLKIQYDNGSLDELAIMFTDIAAPFPQFGEIIARNKIRSIEKKADGSVEYGIGIRFFAKTYPIKNNKHAITKIILPDCANMHIYAITLVKHIV